jgi:hypothetical protein
VTVVVDAAGGDVLLVGPAVDEVAVAVVLVVLGSPGSAVTAGANAPISRHPRMAATSA